LKVLITDEAKGDLLAIGRFIARDNPARAETFVTELEERCRGLAEMPLGFPLVPGHAHSGIRRRAHGHYLIFYRVEKERVVVLHVLHGAMDVESVLFPEP
jgi:toxin ParE1/3/4